MTEESRLVPRDAADNEVVVDPPAPAAIEPLSLSLMGKLFGVPLIIIGSIVGGAVLVVVLFGAPASPEPQPIESLIQALESGSGEKSLGILLPQEKKLWQTALELAKRLEKKDVEATPGELQSIAKRLGDLVQTDLEHLENLPTIGMERANQEAIRSKRLVFLIQALGKTEREEALAPLLAVVRTQREPYITAAMKQLGDLHSLEGASESIGPILDVLNHSASSAEAKLVACTALAVLGEKGDPLILEGLAAIRVTGGGELSWSASLAMAHLGSAGGKETLKDLLDRSFWETGDRYEIVDATGGLRRYPMPPGRVDAFLKAAIEAARHLEDADLWEMVERLKSDKSAAVRAAAMKAAEVRQGDQAARTDAKG